MPTETVYQAVSNAELKFSGIEFSANRALAYAILAAEAPSAYVMFYRLLKVYSELEKFVSLLSQDYLDSLTDSQQHRLCLRMQDAHTILARFLRSPEAARIVRFPLLGSLVTRLQERTDDLDDVLEGVFLARDSQPKALMAACEAHIDAYRKTHLSESRIDGELFYQFQRLCKQWRLTDPGLGSEFERVVQGISQQRVPHQTRKVQATVQLELCIYRPTGNNPHRQEKYDWRIIALSEKASGVISPILVYRKPVGSDVNQELLRLVLADVVREASLRLGGCAVADCGGLVSPIEPTESERVCGATHVKNRCSECGTIYWRTEDI